MTVGALIAHVYDAVEPLPLDRDLAAWLAAYCVTTVQRGRGGEA